jgi:hypothetical protein
MSLLFFILISSFLIRVAVVDHQKVVANEPFIFYFNFFFSYQQQPKSRRCLPISAATTQSRRC